MIMGCTGWKMVADTIGASNLPVDNDGAVERFVDGVSLLEVMGLLGGVLGVLKTVSWWQNRQQKKIEERYKELKSIYKNRDYEHCEAKCREMLRFCFLSRKQRIMVNYNLGYTLLKQRKYGEAMRFFRRAVRIDSSHRPSWNCIGACLETLKKPGEAIEAYKRACGGREMSYPNPWNGLGVLYFERGELERALECYEQAVDCQSEKHDYYKDLLGCGMEKKFVSNLMEAYIAGGELVKAQELYQNRREDLGGFRGNFLYAVCMLLEGKTLDDSVRSRLVRQSARGGNIGYSPDTLKRYLLELDGIDYLFRKEAIGLIEQIKEYRARMGGPAFG